MPATLSVLRKQHRKLKEIKGPKTVRAGFPKSKSSQSNIEKAIWNEFGTRGGGWGGPIPERPFMRNTMRNNLGKYKDQLAKAAEKVILGEITLEAAMERFGIMIQGDIQEEIMSLDSPPNSPVTIALKGSSNPLIDTGAMRAAVTYEVK